MTYIDWTDIGDSAGTISIDSLVETTKNLEEEALKCFAQSTTSKEVESLRVLYLGQKGKITGHRYFPIH